MIDVAKVITGLGTAAQPAESGAAAVKIEHRSLGDRTRWMWWELDGAAMWWQWISGEKRRVTLNLVHPEAKTSS